MYRTIKSPSILFFRLFILYCLFPTSFVKAQIPETNPDFLRTKNWYFGDSIGLKFILSDTLVSIPNLRGWTYEGTSIINDQFGNLKYYSNGFNLYDSSNKLITDKLKGGVSSSQQISMHQFNEYIYIYTTAPELGVGLDGYNYSIYDTNLDSFVFLNKKLIKRVGEKQASVNHQNNNYIWNVVHSQEDNLFYCYILNSSNTISCPLIQKFGIVYPNLNPSQGILKFSPNGQICANMNWNLLNFELSKFNRETGFLSDLVTVPIFYPYGIEFSNSSNNIFISDRGKHIFKYSIDKFTESNIVNSKDTLFSISQDKFSQLQLGINGCIYISNYRDSFLSIIKNPNLVHSNFIYKGVSLVRRCQGGLPNFNSSYFYTPSIDFAYTEDCWEHSYAFEGRDTFDADGYKWLFRDVRNETLDTRQGKNVMYTFPQADSLENKYEVSHIAYNANRADTVTKTLTIRPKWKNDVLGRDTFYCTGDSIKLILQAPQDMHCVHWNEEEPNLDEALGPIVDYDHFHTDSLLVDTAGTYIVKVTNKTFCQMWDTIRVTEKPNPQQPNIQRISQELESTIAAAEYRWYYEGRPKFQNSNSKIQPDSNGYWQVQLVSEYGCESELSYSLLVDFASVDVIESNNSLVFNVYPNPSDGKVTIEVPENGMYHVTIIDLNGKRVRLSDSPQSELYRSKNRRIEINTQLAAGTYILTITDSSGHTGSKKQTIVN
jgi:hypothetical protein